MAFLIDTQELKPGLIIFRRADVKHRNWYCRIKVPRTDRYKTVSLKTADIDAATERAFDQDADVRFRIKHEVPIFNRPFNQIAKEYANLQKERVVAGQITKKRWELVDSTIRANLNRYVGPVQITLVGQDRWDRYPIWRQTTWQERRVREMEERRTAKDASPSVKVLPEHISDATIRTEMSIFRAVMAYAAGKKYVPESHVFKGNLPLAKERREEFTPEEYRKLHTFARGWIKKARGPVQTWTRTVVYNFVLIMCNTGMRPPEAKNLRWRDVSIRTDKQGRKFVVLQVRGKGKSGSLVAAGNVADYLERIRAISKATKDDDFVFTTSTGARAGDLYKRVIPMLLEASGLLFSSSGKRRSTYCFRHTYATFRLCEGVDALFLATQMRTSVKIIQDHYGHVNPVKNAERILQGMPGWEPIAAVPKEPTEAGRVNAETAKDRAVKPKAKKARKSDRALEPV